MIYDTNFNKDLFVDWSKVFIMSKHVFTTSPIQLQFPIGLKK